MKWRSTLIAAFTAAMVIAPTFAFAQAKSEDFVTLQPPGQWLASQFIGQPVTNSAGETIGNISDLLFDKSGRIANVVIGVGGILGIGEKEVAIGYGALGITADANGKRVFTLDMSKERLKAAPEFRATEKTAYMRAKEEASEMGRRAAEKARELKDKAAKKIDDMRR